VDKILFNVCCFIAVAFTTRQAEASFVLIIFIQVQWSWLTCLPGQQVFSLKCGDVRHRCEDMCTVNYGSFDAVSLVDASVASFFVQYELPHQYSPTSVALTLMRHPTPQAHMPVPGVL